MQNEFEHPNGERLKFTKTSAETNGELLEMEAVYQPHSEPPPLHYHPAQEEQFEVLAGEFRVRIGERERTYQVGETFTVPPNTPHWMHNLSDEDGRLRWQIRPALKSQDFFATLWGLAADDKLEPTGRPNLWQLAVIMRAYRDEFRVCSPPYFLQLILFGILAPIGRLKGFKAKYDEYSG